ncbi:hypothetical protein M7I_2135 [Glarea lozoyensis 74030]|uniref:LysM domain-containing protein n=1 Tax=Glarea lozoyensis (strain ATCC 74030 / MF5533) TaxID=1104152 RepID=H0EHZ1_GLAL7|nr:hypothetical protein M7I_2135 [Glarea lozoyensis 74030]
MGVGIPGTPTQPPVTTTSTTPGNGIQTPQPTQPGMVSNCDAFYFVSPGDRCQMIADKNGISLTQFITWNNVGGASCPGLQANVNIADRSGISLAQFISWNDVGGASCGGLQANVNVCQLRYVRPLLQLQRNQERCVDAKLGIRITAAQFNAWNPQVGADCRLLFLGYYVCVGV